MSKDDKAVQLDKKGQDALLAILTSKTMTEAAKKLSISRNTLYNYIDKYNLREHIDKVPQQALENLKLASLSATDVLVDGLNDRRERYNNAKDILDRVGVGVKKNDTNVNVNVMQGLKIVTGETD